MHILVKNEVSFCLCPENLSKAEAKDNGRIHSCGTGNFMQEQSDGDKKAVVWH